MRRARDMTADAPCRLLPSAGYDDQRTKRRIGPTSTPGDTLSMESGEPPRHVEPTGAHVQESRKALETLAAIWNEATPPASQVMYIRFGHFNHHAFLSPLLYGFPILHHAGDTKSPPAIAGLETLPSGFATNVLGALVEAERIPSIVHPNQAILLDVESSTGPEHPLTWAVTPTISVRDQIAHCLQAVATIVFRRRLLAKGPVGDVSKLPSLASASDQQVSLEVRTILAAEGWEQATRILATRLNEPALSIHLDYAAPMIPLQELSLRCPLLRYVYNNLTPAREVVDRVAAMLSQRFDVKGDAPLAQLAEYRGLIDASAIRPMLAHMARDSFVCGNGYLIVDQESPLGLRLLRPETVVRIDDPEHVTSVDSAGRTVVDRLLLHEAGVPQLESPYGISVLEPLLRNVAEQDLYLHLTLVSHVFLSAENVPQTAIEYARMLQDLTPPRLAQLSEEAEKILNGGARHLPKPEPGLYFAGTELMSDASRGISIGTPAPRGRPT
jgi:hypothetical protein